MLHLKKKGFSVEAKKYNNVQHLNGPRCQWVKKQISTSASKKCLGSDCDRLSENAKSEIISVDIKELMTRKSVKTPILGQPVDL